MPSKNKNCVKMSKLSVLGGGEACGARWTLGALLLAPLAAANSSYCAVPAVLLLAVFATLGSKGNVQVHILKYKQARSYITRT